MREIQEDELKAKSGVAVKKGDDQVTLEKTGLSEPEHSAEPRNDAEASQKIDSDLEKLSFLETAQSVLYAFLGVQKSKNAKRDFSKGKASHFIILGITFGILFVLSVALVVTLILEQFAA